MELWRTVWRNGIVPQLDTGTLLALSSALQQDDPRIIQGATTEPPPLMVVQEWECKGACILGFTAMLEGFTKVGEVENRFAELCGGADRILGSDCRPGTVVVFCRFFNNWFDSHPREMVRQELLAELQLALSVA